MKQLSKIMLAAVAYLRPPRLPGISQQADPQRLTSIRLVAKQIMKLLRKSQQQAMDFPVLVQV